MGIHETDEGLEQGLREQAQNDPEGKIVGTRWLFADKGDKVRCRLVAQEFAGGDKREDLYAGTPPLSSDQISPLR